MRFKFLYQVAGLFCDAAAGWIFYCRCIRSFSNEIIAVLMFLLWSCNCFDVSAILLLMF